MTLCGPGDELSSQELRTKCPSKNHDENARTWRHVKTWGPTFSIRRVETSTITISSHSTKLCWQKQPLTNRSRPVSRNEDCEEERQNNQPQDAGTSLTMIQTRSYIISNRFSMGFDNVVIAEASVKEGIMVSSMWWVFVVVMSFSSSCSRNQWLTEHGSNEEHLEVTKTGRWRNMGNSKMAVTELGCRMKKLSCLNEYK